MSHLTLAPYVLGEADGTDPKIVFPVQTPAAFVQVESPGRGRFIVKASNRDGVPIAIEAAKKYVRAHPIRLGQLYDQLIALQRETAERAAR